MSTPPKYIGLPLRVGASETSSYPPGSSLVTRSFPSNSLRIARKAANVESAPGDEFLTPEEPIVFAADSFARGGFLATAFLRDRVGIAGLYDRNNANAYSRHS